MHAVQEEAAIETVELAAVTQIVEVEPVLQIGRVTAMFPAVEVAVFPAVEVAVFSAVVEVAVFPAVEVAVFPAVEVVVFPAVEVAVFPAVKVAVVVQGKHLYRPKTQKLRKRCAQRIPQCLPDSLPIRCCPNYDSSNRSGPS